MNNNYVKNRITFGFTIATLGLVTAIGGTCYAQNTGSEEYKEYVLMNIPYGEFFEGEYEGGERIDAVSTATLNKAGNEGLTGGSYHTEDLSQILGVSFPVAVSDGVVLDENLEVSTPEELFGAADYSYVKLSEIPDYYKVITNSDESVSFSKAIGETEDYPYESVTITTSSPWGDYVIEFDQSISELSVYAAVVRTVEGNSYGLRTMENIWRGFELAFTVTEGFQEPHGNIVAYEAYQDIAGETINEIIYYTSDGMKRFSVDLYVPVKFENVISIADAKIIDGKTTVTTAGFPEDYEAVYQVSGSGNDMTCEADTISWSKALAGTYTLNISDASGKYAPYSQSFILSTDNTAAMAGNECIVKKDGASDEEFTAYISNITSFTVGEQEVSAGGKKGANLVLEDGSVDKTQSRVFSEVGDYEIIIHSAGSEDITLSVHIDEVAEGESNGGPGEKH